LTRHVVATKNEINKSRIIIPETTTSNLNKKLKTIRTILPVLVLFSPPEVFKQIEKAFREEGFFYCMII
jgi:hypothetical protein